MNFNKFTIKAQEAVQQAQQISLVSGHQSIEPAHLLKGLLDIDESVTPFLLKKVGVNEGIIRQALDKMIESFPKVEGGGQHLGQKANEVLVKAQDLLSEFGDEFVSIEHILLGLLKVKDQAASLLKDSGVSYAELKKAILELRKGSNVNSQGAEETYNALGKFAIHLNEQARNGKLDPVIGRDEEIRRVLQILSRRTKNNPILIGEPGVGKTAIAEGLAHRIVNGDVPENLKDKELYSLDMGALVAGAKYKGEFEERLKAVVKEVTGSDGHIVLFIDEIHTLVGAGKSEGAMDATNILKPALARGELRAIGATTLSEYQKYFEKDKALERRFQTVLVDEPAEEDAISILRGLKERYETHHKVRITDEAIISAVRLSQRYITDRFLPDKAIDLMDEAAAKLRMQINSMPVELDEAERKLRQLEIEQEAIKRESDTKKLEDLQRQIAELKERRDTLKAKWQGEKEVVEGIQHEKQRLEELKQEAEQAERQGDLGRVAEIRYGLVGEAEENLKHLEEKWETMETEGSRMIKEEVESEDIADVVGKWTGIPVTKMLQTETEKLLHLEDELHKRVVSQDEAITAVADAVRRSRTGLQDENRPIGSFIFLGTTGVGKTELAKALAEYLFDNEDAMTRIDMSEYQESHSVSRLVGAPPGYVGYDEGGQLTEAVRRKPYSVVLLDEIEKAHPDVFNTLLQVLDDGRLTDNKGRIANFKNTIIIMTSNLGSDIITRNFDGATEADMDRVMDRTDMEMKEMLRKALKPEFLNRIDETIVFKPLNRKDVKAIVRMHLKTLKKMLAAQDIRLTASDEAIDFLGDAGFDPQFGARPIKRVIQKKVLNELSKQLLAGKVQKGQDLVLDIFDGQFVFRKPITADEVVNN